MGTRARSTAGTAHPTAVTSPEELREILGPPSERAATKVRDRLARIQAEWIAASPLCLVSTSSAAGRCDVSPKGDPEGAVLVIDETTIAVPDRPGNRRADGYLNVLENPHVGLIFLVPGRVDTLRVNGSARVLRDAPYFDDLTVRGHRPALALEVRVEEVFFHCGKAFLRSMVWDPATWNPGALPSRARIAQLLELSSGPLEVLEASYGPSYAENLY